MKKLSILAAACAVLTLGHSAFAQTTIRVTGSTAFRNSFYTAVDHVLDPGYSVAFAGAAQGSGLSYLKAAQATIVGTVKAGTTFTNLPAGTSVIIKTSFQGSVGGIKTLTQNRTDGENTKWIKESLASTYPGTASIDATVSGNTDGAITADVTMSDSFQAETSYKTPTLTGANAYTGGVLGVVTFTWAKNVGANSGITNITNRLVKNLLDGGCALAQFTGNTADNGLDPDTGATTGPIVYGVGRDEDSGTRLGAFAESGYGVFTSPQQYQIQPLVGSGGATITNFVLYPAQTVLGTAYGTGHSGYSGGGDVFNALNQSVPAAPAASAFPNSNKLDAYFVGYLSTGDASTLTKLSWNGVAFSLANVESGLYTFWSYEHMYYRSTFASTQKALANAIAKQLHDSTDSNVSGVQLSLMSVGRTSGSTSVTWGNPY